MSRTFTNRRYEPEEEPTGRTVQCIAFHPFERKKILWGLGLLEPNEIPPPGFSGPKPRAWQNLGGKQELNELELFLKIFVGHPLLQLLERKDLQDKDKAILAGGIRELVYESGYDQVVPDVPTNGDDFRFGTYRYQSGHEVTTLMVQVNSIMPSVSVVEYTEIGETAWFDITQPWCELFRGRILHPFYSHVRRTLAAAAERDRRTARDTGRGGKVELLTELFHPCWRLVHPIGRGDSRFPTVGYLIPPDDWMILFRDMVDKGIEMYDLDFLYNRFSDRIKTFKNRGLGQLAAGGGAEKPLESDGSLVFTQASAKQREGTEAEDAGEIQTPDMLAQETAALTAIYEDIQISRHDAEWLAWVKREYGV